MPEARLKGKLSLDDTQFHAALRKASQAGVAFASKLGSVMKAGAVAGIVAVTTAVIAMAAVLAKAVQRAIDLGGTFDDMKKQTGASVKNLVLLTKAFDLSGVGGDKLSGVLNKLQKAVEAGDESFADLGLSLDDLRRMTPDQQLMAVGNAIAKIQDPAKKTAAAMGLFGKSGGELLKFFGGDDLDKAVTVLGSMPDILEENAALFADLGDAVGNMSSKWDAFAVGIASKLAPVLEPLLDKIIAADTASFGAALGEDLSNMFAGKSIGEGLTTLAGNFVRVMTAAAIAVGEILMSALTSAFNGPIAWLQSHIETAVSAILRMTGQDKSVDVDEINRAIKVKQEMQDDLGYVPGTNKQRGNAFGAKLQDDIDALVAQRDEAIASGNISETREQKEKRIRDEGAKVGFGGGSTATEMMDKALARIGAAVTTALPKAAASAKVEVAKIQAAGQTYGPPMAPQMHGPPMRTPGQGSQWEALQSGQSSFEKLQARAASGAKVGSESLLTVGPSRVTGGVRKRGESREEFRARIDKAKGINKKEETTGEAIKATADTSKKILKALGGEE